MSYDRKNMEIKKQTIKNPTNKTKNTKTTHPPRIPAVYHTPVRRIMTPLPLLPRRMRINSVDETRTDKAGQDETRRDSHDGRAISRCQTPCIFLRASRRTLGDLAPLQSEGAKGRQIQQRRRRIRSVDG